MHLGPALYPFLAQHPRIELTLELDDRRVDAAADGYDAVVRHGTARGLAPDGLATGAEPARPRRVAGATSHATGRRRSLAELERHRGIFYTNRGVADWRFPGAEGAVIVRGRVGPAGQQRRPDARRGPGRPRHRAPADLHRRGRGQGRRADASSMWVPSRRPNSSTWPIPKGGAPRPSCARWPTACAPRSASRPTGRCAECRGAPGSSAPTATTGRRRGCPGSTAPRSPVPAARSSWPCARTAIPAGSSRGRR